MRRGRGSKVQPAFHGPAPCFLFFFVHRSRACQEAPPVVVPAMRCRCEIKNITAKTPQDVGPFFRRNFISRHIGIEQKKVASYPRTRPEANPGGLAWWLVVGCGGARRVIKKQLLVFGF